MACNIKKPAKLPRILAGIVIILIGLYFQIYLVALLGLLPIAFGISGFCPMCYVKNYISKE
jgi:uncharacterized membrane protein YiaA